MPDESASPSTGWRGVYAAMGASTAAEATGASTPGRGTGSRSGVGSGSRGTTADDRDCPTCGGPSRPVGGGRYRCPDHGAWRAGASATG